MARKQSLSKMKRKNSRNNQLRNREKGKVIREWQKGKKTGKKNRKIPEHKENINQNSGSSKMNNKRNKHKKYKKEIQTDSSTDTKLSDYNSVSDCQESTDKITSKEEHQKETSDNDSEYTENTHDFRSEKKQSKDTSDDDPISQESSDQITSKHKRTKDHSNMVTDHKGPLDQKTSKKKHQKEKSKNESVHNHFPKKEPVSRLKDIFYSDLDEKEICDDLDFLKDKEALAQEISYFGHLIGDPEHDKALVIFMAENISKCCDKKNMVMFLTICFRLFENIDMKRSIFVLRMLMILTKLDSFVPVTVQLIKIYKIGFQHEFSDSTDKIIDYERLKLSSDVLKSVQLKEFVLEESLALLFANLNSISNCLGFPEFAEPVISALKENVTDDNFDLKDFLKRIQTQIELIRQKRTGLSFVCHEDLVEFEKSTTKMIE